MIAVPPIIDTHAHVFTVDMPVTDTSWTHPTCDYSVEHYIADLDAHGVAFGVVTAASLFGDYNDYTLDALRRFPRLRATVMLAPEVDPCHLADLRAAGVRGVRIQLPPTAPPINVESWRYRRFLRRLADIGFHAELNLGEAQLAAMLPAIRAQGVQVIVDHFGLLRSQGGMEGAGFQALLRSFDQGGTWVKISAHFRLPDAMLQPCVDRLLSVAGPDFLLWGSDAPFVGKEADTDYADTVRTFQRLIPDASIRRRISDAGLRLYFF